MKLLTLILLLLTGFAMQAQTVSPINPVVFQGQTVSMFCTANCGLGGTWSCSGCAGSINPSTGVYTAPSAVIAQQSFGGYQLLPNNHIFNTRIDSLPTRSDSGTLIAGAGTVPVNFLVSFPFNYTNNSTPTDTMVFGYTPANNGIFQVPSFPNARVEGGWLSARADDNSDHHFIRINTDTGQAQEQYQYYPVGSNSGCLTCNSQSGLKYNTTDYGLPAHGATDAAGMFLTPLTLRVQEVEQACANGTPITHALRMTLQNGYLHNAFLWPATTSANAGPGANYYGERVRLKSTFDASSFSACAQILLTQMKNYGLIIADGGYGWQVTVEYDAWPAGLMNAFQEINNARIATSNWEVVDESSLELSSSSGEANTNRERICFTSSSGAACTEVVLAGVGVNLPQNILYIMAGTPAQQFSAMVQGGGSNTVTWSMSPSVGTLTSGGLYTAPSSISSPVSTMITATSTVNSSVAASMVVWLFPATGFYGITATTPNYTDTSGNLWTAGIGYGTSTTPEVLGCCQHDSAFPTTVPNYQLYWNQLASSVNGGDVNTNFVAPAGTYLVTYRVDPQLAVGQRKTSFISQGTILATIDPAAASGGTNLPFTFTTSVTVGNNNQLAFYIWGAGGVPVGGADISSISVVPILIDVTTSRVPPPTDLTGAVK